MARGRNMPVVSTYDPNANTVTPLSRTLRTLNNIYDNGVVILTYDTGVVTKLLFSTPCLVCATRSPKLRRIGSPERSMPVLLEHALIGPVCPWLCRRRSEPRSNQPNVKASPEVRWEVSCRRICSMRCAWVKKGNNCGWLKFLQQSCDTPSPCS